MSEVQAETLPEDVKEFFSNIKIEVTPTGPQFESIWVVKMVKSGFYLRVPSVGRSITVKSLRMATRFDSYGWAMTMTSLYAENEVKVVRLVTRAEKELRTGRRWVHRGTKAGDAFVETKPSGVATSSGDTKGTEQ